MATCGHEAIASRLAPEKSRPIYTAITPVPPACQRRLSRGGWLVCVSRISAAHFWGRQTVEFTDPHSSVTVPNRLVIPLGLHGAVLYDLFSGIKLTISHRRPRYKTL